MNIYPIRERILPTDPAYGFSMEDHWVWCGSAILGEDGRYHMFSARWPKTLPFFRGYVVSSEIVHASSDTPFGPYRFEDVVLGDRGEAYWDGRMTHNPSVVKYGDTYALFYIGSAYKGPRPDYRALTSSAKHPTVDECYANIKIGIATSKSVYGPWERRDAPILDRSGHGWDSTVVTNPAPCVLSDGSVLLYYRSNTPQGLKIGVAKAKDFFSPFERITDTPIFDKFPGMTVEDPFVWQNGDHIELIAKDIDGSACGEKWGGVHMVSRDSVDFDFAPDRKAYSRAVRFTDGTEVTAYHLERPNITFKDGKPLFISAAYGEDGAELPPNGSPNFDRMTMSKTLILPLAQD